MSISVLRDCTAMTDLRMEEILSYIKTHLPPKRFSHSLGTAELCRNLADRFGLDANKAFLAGLLHDIAREFSGKKLKEEAKRAGIQFSALEEKNPILLHGKVAAFLVRSQFGIEDADILEAIANHSLGKPGLNPYGKILFVADSIEPSRTFIDERFRSRILSLSLDEMVLSLLEEEKKYRNNLAPITQALYDELKGKVLEKAQKNQI